MDDGGCNLIDFPSIKEKKIEDLHLEHSFTVLSLLKIFVHLCKTNAKEKSSQDVCDP